MQGVYWWSIWFDDDPNTPPDDKTASRLDFAGRPLTEKAVKDCFTSDCAGPGADSLMALVAARELEKHPGARSSTT